MTLEGAPRSCPICDSVNRRLVFRQTFAVVDHGTPVTGYDVVVCGRCGCSYADGIPEQATLDNYYREMSKYEYAQRGGAESDFDSKRLALIAAVIAPLLPSRDVRILDIGCASGRLLANLRDMGFPNVEGLDPSPACARSAADLYSIKVRSLTLDEMAGSGELFDVVTMVGVLEHLRDMKEAFENLNALISPGGLLYVEVPDVTGFVDWPNAPYQDFSTEHINFFGPVSLQNLMTRRGFSPVFLERNHRQQSHRTVMSNISGMFRRDSEWQSEIVFDADSAAGLDRYLACCAEAEDRLLARIAAIVDAGRPIIVWGVGTHTSRLMTTSRLNDAHIVAFIESNSRYQGRTLLGRPILPPQALKERAEPVLISSRVFQQEIVDQIQKELGCSNELILLYDV